MYWNYNENLEVRLTPFDFQWQDLYEAVSVSSILTMQKISTYGHMIADQVTNSFVCVCGTDLSVDRCPYSSILQKYFKEYMFYYFNI